MTRSVVLGLDVGGSYVKATAFDLERRTARTLGAPVRLSHPAPGHNERDPQAMWRQTAEVVYALVSALDDRQDVCAVGITGHGNGLYLVDARGRPTRAAVMASDTRTAAGVRRLIDEGAQDRLAPVTWNRLWAGQPGPLLRWLQAHEPESLQRSAHALMCKDFVRAQLTATVTTELTDQSCNGLYNNRSGEYSDDVLETLDIAHLMRLMPSVVSSAEVVGTITREAEELTGIPSGTPVVGGVVDNVALHLGSGVLDGSRICVAAGTWSVNQLLTTRAGMAARTSSPDRLPFAACVGAEPGSALLIEASPTSASALAWAVDQALGGVREHASATGTDVFELALRRVAAVPPAHSNPLFVPYLDGSRDNPAARGAWLGLSSSHGEDEMLAAVVEGVCFEHRSHVDRLDSDGGRLPLRLSGGAAKSATWAQRFADVTGRVVEVSTSQELGAVGAAVIAGVGVGAFESLQHGVDVLNPGQTVFEPDAQAVEFYEARYQRYRRLADLVSQDFTS